MIFKFTFVLVFHLTKLLQDLQDHSKLNEPEMYHFAMKSYEVNLNIFDIKFKVLSFLNIILDYIIKIFNIAYIFTWNTVKTS